MKAYDIDEDPQEEPRTGDSYENVAKAMNCSTLLLKRLEQISNLKFMAGFIKDQSELKRNLGWRCCGRYYYNKENVIKRREKNIVPIFWFGIFFNRQTNYQLCIGFPETLNNEKRSLPNIQEKLTENHYNYYSEFTQILTAYSGYWHYIFLDNFLLSQYCGKIRDAKKEILRIIKNVLE